MVIKNILTLIIFVFGLVSCGWVKQFAGNKYPDVEEVIAGRSEIKLVATEQNKFMPQIIIVRPGQTLKLKVVNKLKSGPLAFVVLKKDEDPIVNAFLGIQAGESHMWAPPSEHILVKSKLLPSDENQSIEVKLPDEPGDYAFISSYPGHVDYLKGLIKVQVEKPKDETL